MTNYTPPLLSLCFVSFLYLEIAIKSLAVCLVLVIWQRFLSFLILKLLCSFLLSRWFEILVTESTRLMLWACSLLGPRGGTFAHVAVSLALGLFIVLQAHRKFLPKSILVLPSSPSSYISPLNLSNTFPACGSSQWNETHFVFFGHIAVLPKSLYIIFLAEKHKEIYAKGILM